MQQGIEAYKVVRRGKKHCVRVRGFMNTTDAWHWCKERNMEYHIKQHYFVGYRWENYGVYKDRWDYDFLFDDKKQALTFVLGYL